MILPENTQKWLESGEVFVRVQRVGGSDDRITDRDEVMVTCWVKTRSKAWEASRRVKSIVVQFSTGVCAGGR